MVHIAIESARLKLERAKSHVHELRAFLADFVKPERHSVTLEENPSGRSVKCRLQSEPMPPAIPLAFGDAIHNLRAALDHSLGAFLPDIAITKVHFPFDETRTGLISRFTGDRHNGPIRALPSKVWDTICDGIRPYRESEDARFGCDGLVWAVNKLDNIDKHRAVLVVTGVSEINFMDVRTTSTSMKYSKFIQPVGKDLEIFNFPGQMLHADYSADIDVFIDEPQIIDFRPILPTLIQMGQYVYEAVEMLAELSP